MKPVYSVDKARNKPGVFAPHRINGSLKISPQREQVKIYLL
jgi:hypothetical protein